MKPTCSIVIRAFNEEKHIGRLLTGIFQQTVRDVQVILVDSGSTDGTMTVAAGFPVEVVHIKPEEFSFGYSLNQGIARCTADKVVFASAHVYPVYPDWLEKLIQPLNKPQVALTYGKQRGMDTTKFSEHVIFQQWFPDHSVKRQDHPFCNNANAAIRRELWENHPYDENIPALEDLAWANWAQKQGYQIAYVSEAEVIHVHNETWAGVFNRYRREGMAFKRLYPQERFSLWDLFRLFFVNSVNDLRQINNRMYQTLGSSAGTSPSTGSGPSTNSGYGESLLTGSGPSTGSGRGESPLTGSGRETGAGAGESALTGSGPSTSSGHGESPSTGSGRETTAGRGNGKIRRVYEIIRFRWAQFRGTYLGYRQSSNQLTWKLKQTFYYPKGTILGVESTPRNVEPILYPEPTGSKTTGRPV